MGWIMWNTLRALTVDAQGQVLLGSPDTAGVVIPSWRPIVGDQGHWVAYVKPETHEVFFAYNSNAVFNGAYGTTTFTNDVVVKGSLVAKNVARAYGRGPTDAPLHANYNITGWVSGGIGVIGVTWGVVLPAPVIIATAEYTQSVTATVANVTPQSCTVSVVTLANPPVPVNCFVNIMVLGS